MFKKFAYTLLLSLPGSVLANQPKDWQLGFQKSASGRHERYSLVS